MVRDRSWRGVMCADGGNCAAKAGSSARTASVTAMVLLPGWRITCIVMARCESVLPWSLV